MIDPAAATAKVTGVIGAGNGASLDATQAMIDALADCWDDCEAALARDPARSNPYERHVRHWHASELNKLMGDSPSAIGNVLARYWWTRP